MKKYFKFLLIIPVIALMASGCNVTESSSVQESEQNTVESNQQRMTNAVPVPQLKESLERQNISKRLQLFDANDKVSYIYLVNFGKVMAFYTIKGKVTSSSKRLTTNQKIIQNESYETGNYSVVESPSLDGAYGTSDEYVFFWTTDGTYVQWSGDYMLADTPLKLTQQPELIQDITKR